MKYRVWELKKKGYEKLRLETTDRHQAFEALRQLSGPKRFAYIMRCNGGAKFLVGTLDGKVTRSDVRRAVRRLIR
jgi:hypothetical protein